MPKAMHALLGDRDWLKSRIDAGLSQRQIAVEAGTKATNVAHYVRKHDLITNTERGERIRQSIAERYPCGRRGPLAANWQGGRMSTTGRKPGGYVRLWMPDHPYANKGGYVYEHRWVMEQKLGRPVLPEEVVDHIDRNRSNNHPDNLRLHESRSQHVKDHFSARDQLVALVGKIRAIPVHYGVDGQCFEGVVDVPALHAVLDEAMAGLQ